MIEWIKLQFEAWIERRVLAKQCQTCEVLREQLFISNTEKAKLLEQIIELTNPKPTEIQEEKVYEPIKPRMVPWHIKKSMLEAEARAEAKIKRESGDQIFKETNDLETEVMKLADERLQDNG